MYTSILYVLDHCFYLPLNHLFLSTIVPEQLYCNEKVIFCYKQIDSTRIAGGFCVSGISIFPEHEKLQCPQLAKAITKKPDDLHPAHGSLLYMTIFYIIYTSLSIIYRQHRYFTLKKIRPRVILNIEKGKAREAAYPQ